MIRKLSLAVLAASLLVPAAVVAQDAASSASSGDAKTRTILSHMPKEIVDCQPHDEAREAADAKLTQTAWDLVNKHEIAALGGMLPQLEAAAAHAPDKPSLPEKCDGKLIVYSDNMMDLILAGGVARKAAGVSTVVQHPLLPYARLDFVIGWTYFELNRRDGAADWYHKGLLNNPRDPLLASEYAGALAQAGRSADALAYVDTYMAENDDMRAPVRAAMLRRRGFALGELGRHQEAIAAYQDSLKDDPASEVAKKEIQWNQSKLGAH